MSYGERTVIEGMLAMLAPRLSIEIGRAEGGSLRRIATHSEEVVSFDIVEPSEHLQRLQNATLMTGDSHEQLPVELKRIAKEGRNVDFVLVDGDHTAEGVCKDMQHLLGSSATQNTVILAHDTLNEDVRRGLEELDYGAYEKVAWVDLDFVPGYVARLPARLGECWGGLGLVVVDSTGTFRDDGARQSVDLFSQPALIWPTARWIRSEGTAAVDGLPSVEVATDVSASQAQLAQLTAELELCRSWLNGIEASASWRLTSPLRRFKRSLRKRLS